MNKREAKRFACDHAARVISSAVGEGWIPVPSEDTTDADEARIAAALDEIVDELQRRGEGG